MNIQRKYSLRKNNTFLLDIHANFFAAPQNLDELIEILGLKVFHDNPFLVIGEGSNILFTKNFEGIVIKPQIMGIEIIEETTETAIIKVGAGENWDNFVAWSVRNGLWGVENLSLIPGAVGSAPIQNIGAYGVEVKDVIVKVEGVNISDRKIKRMSNSECVFEYRSSIFKTSLKNKFIVSSVYFKLSKKEKPTLNYGPLKEKFGAKEKVNLDSIRDAVILIRKSKLPEVNEIGSAGSFFKNPIVQIDKIKTLETQFSSIPKYPVSPGLMKIPAGWLIEQTGWKGKRHGDVGIYPKHALIIVNYGKASGQEVFDFSEQIRTSVFNKFGIDLEREVQII